MLFENVSRGEERRELNIRSVWTEGSAKPSLFFCDFFELEPESYRLQFETPFGIPFSPVF